MKKDCSNCEHMGRDCPKTLMLLSLDELIDWCQYCMDLHKITHERLAHLSNVPKGTIDRVMSKQSTDCRYSTIHAMVCALFEVLGVTSVCLDDVVTTEASQAAEQAQLIKELQHDLADSKKECEALQTHLAESAESLAFMKDQIAKKDDRIDRLSSTVGEWRRIVKILVSLLGLAVFVIIAALAADKLNPNLGFIWRA